MRKSKKGFTLVELVVTVTLMAIVASSAVTLFTDIAKTNKENSYLQVAETCYNICQMYLLEVNSGFSVSTEVKQDDLKLRLNYPIANGGFNLYLSSQMYNENITQTVPNASSNTGLHVYFYKETLDGKTTWVCPKIYYITADSEDFAYQATPNGTSKIVLKKSVVLPLK